MCVLKITHKHTYSQSLLWHLTQFWKSGSWHLLPFILHVSLSFLLRLGFHVFLHCTESHQTICIKCSHGEYQPGWTDKARCLQQKYCDPSQSTERDLCYLPQLVLLKSCLQQFFMIFLIRKYTLWPSVKGFMKRLENPVAEEPCRCIPILQCSPINCEYCERIPTCAAGHGLEPDSGEMHSSRAEERQLELYLKKCWLQNPFMGGRSVWHVKKASFLLATKQNHANSGLGKFPHTGTYAHTQAHTVDLWRPTRMSSLPKMSSLHQENMWFSIPYIACIRTRMHICSCLHHDQHHHGGSSVWRKLGWETEGSWVKPQCKVIW